jgi:hypothetical protein
MEDAHCQIVALKKNKSAKIDLGNGHHSSRNWQCLNDHRNVVRGWRRGVRPQEVNGHALEALVESLERFVEENPRVILCHVLRFPDMDTVTRHAKTCWNYSGLLEIHVMNRLQFTDKARSPVCPERLLHLFLTNVPRIAVVSFSR